jgi:Fe-Mn family superoxide dismutase
MPNGPLAAASVLSLINNNKEDTMSIELPNLPYEINDLEPYVSAETLHFHHDKHHKKYVDTTNELIIGTPYEQLPLEEIVLRSAQYAFKAAKDKKIFNNAAQAWNHEFLWNSMCPNETNRKPSVALKKLLEKDFGSIEDFQKQFQKSGADLFGSGWTWLVKNAEERLVIISTEKAGNPMTNGLQPLVCCDLWEHAYYLDYKNEKGKYMDNFFKVIHWDFIEQNLTQDFSTENHQQNSSKSKEESRPFTL